MYRMEKLKLEYVSQYSAINKAPRKDSEPVHSNIGGLNILSIAGHAKHGCKANDSLVKILGSLQPAY